MDTPDWSKVRVWWVARHRRSGTSHLAATGLGKYKITRCGLRLRGDSRDWRMFDWERVGRMKPTPTCAQCLRFLGSENVSTEIPRDSEQVSLMWRTPPP